MDSSGYTPKAGYICLNTDHFGREPCWWWNSLWKISCPAKSKILCWSIIERKAPTWEVLKECLYQGPGSCCLCKDNEETLVHLSVQCPFSIQIWAEAQRILGFHWQWSGTNFEQALQAWFNYRRQNTSGIYHLSLPGGCGSLETKPFFRAHLLLLRLWQHMSLAYSPISHKQRRYGLLVWTSPCTGLTRLHGVFSVDQPGGLWRGTTLN